MALPPIESLRHRLAAATDAEVHQLVEECRQEVLASLKQDLKERLLRAFLESATQRVGLDPTAPGAPAAEPDAETAAAPEAENPEEVVEADTETDEPFEIREAYHAAAAIDVTPPAASEPLRGEETPDEAADWNHGDSSGLDTAAASGATADAAEESDAARDDAHIDEDILREIEAIRQQISKNEQLLSQLKPFFTESDDA